MDKYVFINRVVQQARTIIAFDEIERSPDPAIRESRLGTPVRDTLRLEAGSYIDTAGTRRTWRAFDLDTAIITVSQRKQIIVTPLQGFAGTVKQYISPGDFEISVSAEVISPYSGVFPEEEIAQIRSILEAPVAIEVASRFLAVWGITNIVVTSFQIDQTKGYENKVILSFAALSDQPVELQFSPDADA